MAHPMHDKIAAAIQLFMRVDENMGHRDLEKLLMAAGIKDEAVADEIIGTLGVFREIVQLLDFEFSFVDLDDLNRKRDTIVNLLMTTLGDDFGTSGKG